MLRTYLYPYHLGRKHAHILCVQLYITHIYIWCIHISCMHTHTQFSKDYVSQPLWLLSGFLDPNPWTSLPLMSTVGFFLFILDFFFPLYNTLNQSSALSFLPQKWLSLPTLPPLPIVFHDTLMIKAIIYFLHSINKSFRVLKIKC